MSRLRSVFAGLVLSLALAPAALAERPAPAPSLRIAYGDLDVGSAAGASALLGRIDRAAAKVCGERWQYSSANPHGLSRCRGATIDAVVGRLGLPALTLAWTGRTGTAGMPMTAR